MGSRDPGGHRPKSLDRRWPGASVAIFASGPSLTREQSDGQCASRSQVCGRRIFVNDAYRVSDFRNSDDVLYACDGDWWDIHRPRLRHAFDCWTQDAGAARKHGLNWAPSVDAPGLSLDRARIHQGGNSGFQALNLAVLWGAEYIELYGFDMRRGDDGRRHFFGDHPPQLMRDLDFARAIRAFEEAAPQLAKLGVEVVNCTPGSALRCFPCARTA